MLKHHLNHPQNPKAPRKKNPDFRIEFRDFEKRRSVMGKGSGRRPSCVTREAWEENFEKTFGRKEIRTWDPEAEAEGPDGPEDTGSSRSRSQDGPDRDTGGCP